MRKVHVLPCGHEQGDKSFLTLMKDVGISLEIPYHAYLIEDSDCNIMVDTGASIRWKELHPKAVQESFPIYMEECEHLDSILESMGFSPKDVDIVINTHMHYDHCGNNAMFPQARFLVNENELAHAFAPGWWEAPSYVRPVFDIPELRYEIMRGTLEVKPGIRIIPTPGHTEGHQSVVVQLKETGTLVIAGDAAYVRENLDDPILPGLYVNARKYAQSMARLKGLTIMRKGTMLLSHSREYLSPHGWKQLKGSVQTFE